MPSTKIWHPSCASPPEMYHHHSFVDSATPTPQPSRSHPVIQPPLALRKSNPVPPLFCDRGRSRGRRRHRRRDRRNKVERAGPDGGEALAGDGAAHGVPGGDAGPVEAPRGPAVAEVEVAGERACGDGRRGGDEGRRRWWWWLLSGAHGGHGGGGCCEEDGGEYQDEHLDSRRGVRVRG